MKPTRQRAATRADTYNLDERPTFAERLSALAGETTWRAPVEGRSTRTKPIPAAHQIAATLAFARTSDPNDIGPDMAYDMVVGSKAHATRIVRAVAEAMGRDRARAIARCRPWLRVIAWAGYAALVDRRDYPVRPSEVSPADWELLTMAAARIMETLADDAIARCEKRWRAAA